MAIFSSGGLTSKLQNSINTQKATDEDSIFNVDDLTGGSDSSSSANLPSWAEDYIKNMSEGDAGNAWNEYTQALKNLNKAPEYIEQYRDSSNKQYGEDIIEPTSDAVNSAIRTAAGSGIVNSSITGDWLKDVADSAFASAEDQNEESNQWAAEQNLDSLSTTANAWGGYTGMLGDYLGLTKQSESEGSSWESILKYLDLARAEEEEDDEENITKWAWM